MTPIAASHSSVRAQYEAYPYPPRAPEEELRRLIPPVLDCLDHLNHYGFSGRRDFRHDFRALVAGGGTGDSIIFLAEQLRGSNAELVYLDLSAASLEVARARAKARNLDNITFIHASLLDAPSLGLGRFDYINCSGVLHHLPDPPAGLAALTALLKDDGVMGLMLYAAYGRRSIYPMQQLLRFIAPEDALPAHERLDIARSTLEALPGTHPLRQTREWFSDLVQFGDAGMYDLLLHAQDRAYSVPQLYALVEGAGLQLTHLFGPSEFMGNRALVPENFVSDPALLTRLATLDLKTRQAVAELLSCRITRHTFYAARSARPLPSPDDAQMAPSFPMCSDAAIYHAMAEAVKNAEHTVRLRSGGDVVSFAKSTAAELIFRYLDGTRSLKDIFRMAMDNPAGKKARLTLPMLRECFGEIYRAMSGDRCSVQWLYLRDGALPPYATLSTLQARMTPPETEKTELPR